jgi:hypothetical protein
MSLQPRARLCAERFLFAGRRQVHDRLIVC